MRTDKTSVVDIISEMDPWVDEVMLLRDIILKTGLLKEEIKWGGPIYTYNGANILAIGAFKNYASIWFHNGAFLSDPLKVLIAASEGTRGLRQWRFASIKEIKPAQIKKYILEAIENEKAGKKIKPEKKPPVEMPAEFQTVFKKDKTLKDAFQKLTPGKQREYLEYVAQAKTEETRIRRVEKSLPNIKAGVGLNDKYKKA